MVVGRNSCIDSGGIGLIGFVGFSGLILLKVGSGGGSDIFAFGFSGLFGAMAILACINVIFFIS